MSQQNVKLKGSGGYIFASVSEEQKKKADLGVGELFLAPLGRIDKSLISNYFCKNCNKEFDSPPEIEFENPQEKVQEGMTLVEKGRYVCKDCKSTIGEYREFSS